MTDFSLDPSDLDWLRRLATDLVGDPAAAEDVVQDATMAALERRHEVERPRSWLVGVTRRLAARRRRTDVRRDRRERAVAQPEAMPDTADLVERAETIEAVVVAARRLPEPFRRTICLRYLEDWSTAEIARNEGRPVDTVRARLRRGLDLLREDLVRSGRERARDWNDWRALIVPLVLPSGRTVPAVAGGASTVMTLGLWTMKMKLIGSGVLAAAVVGLLWLWNESSTERPSLEDRNPSRTSVVDAGKGAGSGAQLEEVEGPERVEVRDPASDSRANPQVGIAGTVRNGVGAPVPSATVFLRPKDPEGAVLEQVTTDAAGRFELPVAAVDKAANAPDAFELGAVADGYRRSFVAGRDVRDGIEIVLGRGRVLSAQVVDEFGGGVPNVRLLVTAVDSRASVNHVSPSRVELRTEKARLSPSTSRFEDAVGLTGARGEVRFEGLPEGALRVRSLDPDWSLEGPREVPAGVVYAEWRAKRTFGVHLTVVDGTGAEEPLRVGAKFLVELGMDDGSVVNTGEWVGSGRNGVTFGLRPEMIPDQGGRQILTVRFYGTFRVGDSEAQEWSAKPLGRGLARVRVRFDGADPSDPKVEEEEEVLTAFVPLDVRYSDGTPFSGPLNVVWQSAGGRRGSDRAEAVGIGRYGIELPQESVFMTVAAGNASGSLSGWSQRLAVRPGLRASLVSLERGARVAITRPVGWVGEWMVHASYRSGPDEEWFGSWNYGTSADEIEFNAVRSAEWRYRLYLPGSTPEKGRTVLSPMLKAGDVVRLNG